MNQRTLAIPLLALALLLPACSSPRVGQDTRQLAADTYPAAFDAALDVLRDRNFDLARIDARAGIIETRPRTSAGALTPWIRHSANADLGIRGAIHHERRIARVRFTPANIVANTNQTPTPPANPDDLRTYTGPVSLRVVVDIQRLYRPGRQLTPTSINLTRTNLGRTASEPDLNATPEIAPAGQDAELARVLADEISRAARP